jgi:arylsulfatase A-like enzyme
MKKEISRRSFIKSATIASAGLMALPHLAGRAKDKKPNVIIITSDQQLKGTFAAYGSHLIKAASLKTLADDGIVFDRAYTPHPTCTPARSSILTGQYASVHGAYTIGTALPPNALKLTDILVDHGYETYGIGKMHFTPVSTEGGFESYPNIMDEDFWRNFDGPYYGFQHTQLLNRHTTERFSCREHYGLWLKENGLTENDLARYFDDQFIGRWELPRRLHPSVFVSEKTCGFIKDHVKLRKEKPFFMWVSFQDPHNPHVAPAPYDTLVDPKETKYKKYVDGELDNKPPIYRELYEKGPGRIHFNDGLGVPCAGPARPDKEDVWRRSIAIHHGMVQLMDEEIGRIIGCLKANGLYDDTIIIFTADHGDYLGSHGFIGKGFPAFEEVFNVPFILKNTKQQQGGRRSKALVSTLDIAPTILDMTGIAVPSRMQGLSQKNVLTGADAGRRKALLIENRAVERGFYQKMIVTDRHKAVYYYGQTYGELYDLSNDPDQYRNLWDNGESAALKRDILCQLYEKNVAGERKQPNTSSVPEILKWLDRQVDEESPVQKRTSFS